MKTIAVRLDGLLVEDSSRLPSDDPIPAAVEFVQALSRGGYERMFVVTSAPEEVASETIRVRLRRYQIPMTDIVRLNPHLDDWPEAAQLLSAAGARSTVLGLYVSTLGDFELGYMADHGVPSVAFVHADPVIDYRPQRGSTWVGYGLNEEDEG